MSIREFLDALRSTQGQHTLASVLEGPESGARLLLCEGVPVWPARPEGLLARNLPALAGCGASGTLTLENKRVFVEKFGGAPRLVICGGGHVAESVVRLAVMLGAFCGLRRVEMTRINLKTDLEENAEGMVLHVHGKGNKERMLPVPAKLASALRKRTGVWLFPGDVQGHCGVDYVAKRIKTVPGYPSHSLRRRFATCVYYRNGCNIVLVSRMLGHANIATTMRYIGLVQDEMRNAVESTTRTDMRLTMPMNQVVGTAGSVATYSLSTARIG